MTAGRIPVTDAVESLGIQPLGLCWARYPHRPQHINQPYTVDCFGLLWSPSGGVFENRHCSQRRLPPGACCLLLPGLEHRYGPTPDSAWQEWLLFCDGWLPRRLLKDGQLRAEEPISVPIDLEQRWLPLREACRNGRAEACCPLACEMFHALSGHQHRQRRREPSHPVWQLADAIRREPQLDRDLPAVARAAGISYSGFRQAFRRLVGCAPHQYLIDERLRLAARLLTEPMPVQDVCRAVGYADPAHFSRLFTRRMGKGPRAFQQSHAVMRG